MEMSVQEFLNSISNPRTRKGYRFGLNKFVEWFSKPAEEILAMRQEDLTQKAGENIVEYRNRAARFEKEIEKFHRTFDKFFIGSAGCRNEPILNFETWGWQASTRQ